MKYAHRNGETEPPSEQALIDGGWYWFNDNREGGGFGMFLLFGGYLLGYGPNDETLATDLDGRWWGPVIPPWQDNA
jgi:hypothetical protein